MARNITASSGSAGVPVSDAYLIKPKHMQAIREVVCRECGVFQLYA